MQPKIDLGKLVKVITGDDKGSYEITL